MNSPHSPDSWIGRRIGDHERYRLDKRLGEGGMGYVFLALDTRLGKQVALKLIKETLLVDDLRKRFEREVEICAALKSHNIVEVSDYGVTADGHPFYVMEHLHGQSLGQLLRREKRLSVERAVGIISQVCEGLRLAHEGVNLWRNGATASEHIKVVHRDLKPDNIFLVPTTLGELVKILDFGIAKILNDNPEYTNITRTSMFIGTFHYAAPEQLAAAENLDERADIYSLGLILYEMLSETDPFGLGLNTNNISGASWAIAHTSTPPVSLRSQPGCEQLDPKIEAVVMRCLQKSPNKRFAKVDELKRALQATVAAERGVSDTTNTQPLKPSDQGIQTTRAQTLPLPRQAVSPDTTRAQTPPPPVQGSSNTIRKPPFLLIGSGIAIALALTFFYYYLPQLSHQLFSEPKSSVEESEFSLANTLAGHSDSVWSVAINPDGQILASGSEDKTIKIWSLGDGKLLRTITGHSDTVRSVAISGDGQVLASGSGDKTIKLWRLDTGELLHTMTGHTGPVWSVAISGDGQTLASSSDDDTIKVWSVGTGKLLRTMTGHAGTVWSVAISGDGQTLASGSQDKTIKIWRLGTGELLRTISENSDVVRAVAISGDGQTLASDSGDKTIIWNLNNGKLLSTLSGHTSRAISIAISDDGQTLASGSLNKTIKIWRLGTGELLGNLSGHSDWVLSVAISPNKQTLVSGSKDQTIKIWRR